MEEKCKDNKARLVKQGKGEGNWIKMGKAKKWITKKNDNKEK